MRIFIDTADIDEIREVARWGILSGVTTNPTLLSKNAGQRHEDIIKEIAELLAKMQIADREKFLAAAADPGLLASLGLEDKGLEGYLFPNTYQFTPMTSEKEIIRIMTEQFRKAAEPIWSQLGGDDKLTA